MCLCMCAWSMSLSSMVPLSTPSFPPDGSSEEGDKTPTLLDAQVHELERSLGDCAYPDTATVRDLACRLGLTEAQIQVRPGTWEGGDGIVGREGGGGKR